MATHGGPGEGAEMGVGRALETILTVLKLLDEQWDTLDDRSRQATIRLTIETARDQRARLAARGKPLD